MPGVRFFYFSSLEAILWRKLIWRGVCRLIKGRFIRWSPLIRILGVLKISSFIISIAIAIAISIAVSRIPHIVVYRSGTLSLEVPFPPIIIDIVTVLVIGFFIPLNLTITQVDHLILITSIQRGPHIGDRSRGWIVILRRSIITLRIIQN